MKKADRHRLDRAAVGAFQGRKAVVIGTSTGIGRALAMKLSREGYTVGLTGRSGSRLLPLQRELPGPSHIKEIDLRNPEKSMACLKALIDEMGGLELIVINAGIRHPNPDLRWAEEDETFKVNAAGFAAMATTAYRHFMRQNSGCLAGISSIAALRGSGESPAYNASKAFMSNYLDGLRLKAMHTPIQVTDLRVGFVHTEMTQGRKSMWLGVSPERAAELIFNAINNNARVAYVPWRWFFLTHVFQSIPDPLNYWLYWRFTDREAAEK